MMHLKLSETSVSKESAACLSWRYTQLFVIIAPIIKNYFGQNIS